MIAPIVIIILRSLKDVFQRKFLWNFYNPPLSFCNLIPQKLQEVKVGIKKLMPIMNRKCFYRFLREKLEKNGSLQLVLKMKYFTIWLVLLRGSF